MRLAPGIKIKHKKYGKCTVVELAEIDDIFVTIKPSNGLAITVANMPTDISIVSKTQTASALSYDEEPVRFNGIHLVKKARKKLGRQDLYADTVFRCLRDLRQQGIINYQCIDHSKSKYRKLK